MFLKRLIRLPGTLASRLTLWYAGVFVVSSLLAFLTFYLMISDLIREREDEDLLGDIKEYSQLLASEGIDKAKAEIDREALSDGVDKIFFRLLSPDGVVLAATDMSSWGAMVTESRALRLLANGADPVFETHRTPGHEHEIRVVSGMIGPGIILQIGESMKEKAEFLEMPRELFGPIMAVVTLFAALSGWFIARRAMKGVEEVTRTAIEISKGGFGSRVPVKNRGDEIERLARSFNHMLDRINALFEEMKEMTDNIAHDLKSPLARIRGAAEMTLTNSESNEETRAMAASTIEECDGLLGTINAMLDIAEEESGRVRLASEKVDMSKLIEGAFELFRPVAEDHKIKMTIHLPDGCVVYGDPRRLQRLVANLVDNALKYTPAGGHVTISAKNDNDRAVLSVSDTGIGMSADELPHIFKRFYRCDQSRSQPGIGLGLSLVKAIALSHGGQVSVSSDPGRGSTFTVTLPASSRKL